MCGRYSLISDISELQTRFDFQGVKSEYVPRFNVAPTQQVLTVIAQDGARTGQYMRWGLIPPWAKDARIGSRMINARAETVGEKPSFRSALRQRRCLVLADGFYEWQKVGASKRPMRIVMKSGDPFAFAGLWESWKDPSGAAVRSCTIITTSANAQLSPIHHRMPVILPRDLEEFWLDTDVQEPSFLSQVLVPYPDNELDTYEVSTLVNSATNDDPAVIQPTT